MTAQTLYEEVEDVLVKRLKNALRSGETVNAPDWVADLARCLALAVVLVDDAAELPRLSAFAHQQLDRCIAEEWAAKDAADED